MNRPLRTAPTLLVIFLSLGLSVVARQGHSLADEVDPLYNGVPLYVSADASLYCDNLEYDNPYQVGRTFFGAHTALSLLYARPNFDFSVGVFLQREFGDEEEISEVLPLLRFRYRGRHARLIAGRIDSGYNHGLPEALLSKQYPFVYPVEEGLQVLASYENLKADAWINWYLLNTPEHREFFAAGLHAQAAWPFLSLDLGLRVSHHGGQLFETGQVSDNLGGMIRLVLSERCSFLDSEVGASGTLLGSIDNPDRAVSAERTEGYGGEAEVFFSPKGWKFYYRIFSGYDFFVEQGEPLYRTPKPLHRFGLRKTFFWDERVRARFQAEGVIIDSSVDYNYFLVIDVFLDLLLHRFPNSDGLI